MLYLYMNYILSPTIQFINSYEFKLKYLMIILMGTIIIYNLIILENIRLLDSPKNLGTLKLLEKSPIMLLLVIIASHITVSCFGNSYMKKFMNGQNPPCPGIYPFLIGKIFMIPRLAMTYSTDNFGQSMDFFIREESILICIQFVFIVLIMPLINLKFVPNNYRSQNKIILLFLLLGITKDLFVYKLWKNYSPICIVDIINRIPLISLQINYAIIIHIFLDLFQCMIDTYALIFSEKLQKILFAEVENEESSESNYIILFIHKVEAYFIDYAIPKNEYNRRKIDDYLIVLRHENKNYLDHPYGSC